jgi:hypothetical protein
MNKKLITLGAALAVLAPIVAHIRNVSWGESSLIAAIFPIFGLLAFTLLWLHAISGVFEEKLREILDFDAFVHWTASLILFSMLAHPLLLLILIKFKISLLFNDDIALGALGLLLLLSYDFFKPFKKSGSFSRHWNKILIVSNIGFVLTFFHSLELGSDLQTGFMHSLWLFYGVTAILALIYTYAVKPFRK